MMGQGELHEFSKSEAEKLVKAVYIATEDPDGESERCGEKLGKLIGDEQIQFVDLVKLLGDKLTSTEVQDRARALDIIYYALNFIKPNVLTEAELVYIVEFMFDRLKDQHLVIPKVLSCIQPIIKCTNLPQGSCSKLLNQVFKEVNIQSHMHRHRRSFFMSLQYMLKYKLVELKSNCSTDFVMHFLQSMDGEKDPRNLLLLFTCIPTVLSNFPLGPFVEDFFDVLACYFPVDFNPVMRTPAHEVITREELVETLHKCLSHTNLFSKYLIPLIMEKLDSSLIDAKLDSLNLFALCCERSYTPTNINPFLETIWHALRREIFLGGNEKVESAALSFIRSAFKVLSRDPVILKRSVTLIFGECKHHLSEPELRLSQPTSRILMAIAESSKESCSEVFGITMTLLYQQFLENTISSNRKGILNIMKRLISTLSAFPSLSVNNLLSQWDEILGMWFTLLSDSDTDFVLLGLDLFGQLFSNQIAHGTNNINTTFALDDKYIDLLQEHLYVLLNKCDELNEISNSVIRVVTNFAYTFPTEFLNNIIPKLLRIVTSIEESTDTNINNVKFNLVIQKAVSECSVVPSIGKVTIPVLLELCLSEHVRKIKVPNPIILCLSETIDKLSKCQQNLKKTKSPNDINELINFICLNMNAHEILIKTTIYFQTNKQYELCESVANVVGSLTRIADEATQQHLINIFWNERVIKSDELIHFEYIPVLLAESLLESLYPSVKIERKSELLQVLLEKISTPQASILHVASDGSNKQDSALHTTSCKSEDLLGCIRLLTVLLNKLKEDEFVIILSFIEKFVNENSLHVKTLQPNVDKIDEHPMDLGESFTQTGETVTMSSSESSCVVDEEVRKQNVAEAALTLLVWTIKSLAMRGFSQLDNWVQKLIFLLDSEELGAHAAEGFSTILSDSQSLTKLNHCIYRFLYKQRIFMISAPKLIEAYRNCSSDNEKFKVNYIKALSCQLKHVPKSVLHTQLVNVIPLLVAGLNITNSEDQQLSATDELVLLSSLKALYELFDVQETPVSNEVSSSDENETRESSLIQYFHDLTPRLLDLITFKNNMEIRVVALKCLQRCAKFPTPTILPLKDEVVLTLKKCLDDSKRLVRREAVVTRNIWILIGAPGGL